MDIGLASLFEALRSIGFKKHANESLTLPLSDDTNGWLGLNRASRSGGPGDMNMHPVCGVRHNQVEQLVAEIRGEKFQRFGAPSVTKPMRYLVPIERRMDWILTRESPEENTAVIADILASLEAYGLPYMRQRTSLEGLAEALLANEGHNHVRIYRAPAALFLLNRPNEALDYLESELRAAADRTDPAVMEFRAFASELERRITRPAET